MAKINVTMSQVGIVALLLFARISMVANSTLLDGKIDLVIIPPATNYDYNYAAFKESIRGLPNITAMGDQKVRVGVVDFHYNGRVLFNMSGNKDDLIQWVAGWVPTKPGADFYYHSYAFEKIKIDKVVFDYKDTKRAKMIMQVLNGWTHQDDKAAAKAAAENLREKGVLIYLTYDAASQHLIQHDRHFKDAQAYVGENYPWRMHGSKTTSHTDLYSKALEDILKHVENITRDLCTFCKYTKNQADCKPDKRPKGSLIDFFGDENARCKNVNPTGIPCPMEECEFECNRQWPWDSISTRPCSDGNAMPCVDRHSRQPPKPPPGMETCLKEVKCNWTCPTTTTTTTTTTTVQIPTKKALPRQDTSTSKSDDSMPMSLIIVLAVVGVVIFIVIVAVLIIVIVARRSSAAKRKAMEDLVNAKKKRAEDRAKHRHRVIAVSGKGGAQDSMGVSMVSTMETTKQGKLGAKSMASPIKKGGKSIMSPSMVKSRSKSPVRKK